jgi:hypothetical protein
MTGGNPVSEVPVTQVKVVGLVSDQGVIPVTAQDHILGQVLVTQARLGTYDEQMRSIEGRKCVWIYKV